MTKNSILGRMEKIYDDRSKQLWQEQKETDTQDEK